MFGFGVVRAVRRRKLTVTGVIPSPSWLLATGSWDDSGVWDDTAAWID